jgi:putative inorganic carbon (hco3(-)) transporter
VSPDALSSVLDRYRADVVVGLGILATTGILYVSPLPLQAALLLAILALGAWRPLGPVLAVPATIGLIYQPIGFGEWIFNPTEVLVGVSAASLAVHVVANAVRDRRDRSGRGTELLERPLRDRFALALAIALLTVGVVSLATVAEPEYLRESVRQFRWVILVPVVYFVLLVTTVADRSARLLLAISFVAGGVVAAMIALAQVALGGGLAVESVSRATGLSPHPNALALYLERVTVFALGAALLYRARVAPWWLLASAILLTGAILTLSRGALVAIAVATIVMLVLGGARRYAIVASSVFLAGGAILAGVASERLLSFFDGGSGSLRLELWRSSIAMIRDHPIFGVGLDQFLYQYLPRYVSPAAWLERFTSHPHQIVLDIWLNLGIMGLLLAGLFGVFAVRRAVDAMRARDGIRLAAFGGIVAGLVHGLFDNSYFLPDLAVMLWLFTALLIPVNQSDSPGARSGHA